MSFDGRVVIAAPEGAVSHDSLHGNGFVTESVISADALLDLLADRFDIALAVVDLGIADGAVLDRLQAAGAPRAIFLLDQQYDAISMAPNVVAYLDAAATGPTIRDAVLAALPAGPGLAVGDFSDRDAQRLNSLGREVERIARALSDIATASQEAVDVSPVDPAAVRALIKRRRDRDRFFPAELFSDPAWDMLLDLTAARLERRQVSVSSLCIAAAVPTTTALRWIRNLCDIGLFERNVDPDDLRRGLISLSDEAADRMLGYLAAGRGAV